MKITMKETRRGCNDGFTVQRFIAGEAYASGKDTGDSLACEFVNRGYATVIEATSPDEALANLLKRLSERKAS